MPQYLAAALAFWLVAAWCIWQGLKMFRTNRLALGNIELGGALILFGAGALLLTA